MSGDIIDAVRSVERAVKNKETTVGTIALLAFGIFIFSLPGKLWHSKWRYALTYGVDANKVQVEDEPHDCAFLAAPLGEKYCHYEQTVSTVRWATSTTNNPIVSYDDGKTWAIFDPGSGVRVPKSNTVESVDVTWEKKTE
jgi:hypothetical protein